MEDNVIWDIIISNLPAILTALGGVLVIYLNYKKDLKKDLQQYVLELNKSQNERIERLSEDNAEQQAEVARLTQKIEAMKEEIDELKTNLSKEMKEKNYYKNRFKEEEAEKELIIQENAGLKKDIEYLKAEINSLKAQLGIPV